MKFIDFDTVNGRRVSIDPDKIASVSDGATPGTCEIQIQGAETITVAHERLAVKEAVVSAVGKRR